MLSIDGSAGIETGVDCSLAKDDDFLCSKIRGCCSKIGLNKSVFELENGVEHVRFERVLAEFASADLQVVALTGDCECHIA